MLSYEIYDVVVIEVDVLIDSDTVAKDETACEVVLRLSEDEVAPCVVLAIFMVDGNFEVLKEIELVADEELFTEVRVATLSEVPKVESTEYDGTRVVDVFRYAGVDPFDNDDDLKLVDELFELVEEISDTFVFSLEPRLVLENNCDEDNTLLVDERLLVYPVDVSEDAELIFLDGYD